MFPYNLWTSPKRRHLFFCSFSRQYPFVPSISNIKVRGERERLSRLKAAHAGVNAKAWDTSHASLDRELVKFQKFLKSKARRFAEEEVLQVHDVPFALGHSRP